MVDLSAGRVGSYNDHHSEPSCPHSLTAVQDTGVFFHVVYRLESFKEFTVRAFLALPLVFFSLSLSFDFFLLFVSLSLSLRLFLDLVTTLEADEPDSERDSESSSPMSPHKETSWPDMPQNGRSWPRPHTLQVSPCCWQP